METKFVLRILCFCMLFVLRTCIASSQYVDKIKPGFEASQIDLIENDGIFLLSNESTFGFGFQATVDVQCFALGVIHLKSEKVVWVANRGFLVTNSDKFVFDKNGNVYLQRGNGVAWSTDTGGKRVASMVLMESGNLVVLSVNGSVLWQSFSYPSDTLLPGQEFVEGMKLQSFPNNRNLFNYLEIVSGDLVLYAGYRTPQVYWSLANDNGERNRSISSRVHSAVLISNSLNVYDQRKALLWKFEISGISDPNATWILVLNSDGAIKFYNLQKGKSDIPEATKIPQSFCSIPEPCDPYYVCNSGNWCQCPLSLYSKFDCKPPVATTCNSSMNSVELFYVGEMLDYFAIQFVQPSLKPNLNACKEACLVNCSCIMLFFEELNGSCFLFDQIGSLSRAQADSVGYVSYLKLSSGELNLEKSTLKNKHMLLVLLIVLPAAAVIVCLVSLSILYYRKRKISMELKTEDTEEEKLFDSFSGMPVRYTFSDLSRATKNFTTKVGQGGFGSVYLGVLPDGTRLAVKKLEGIGQGMKEFRAEVNIIGSLHHVHLVKLKGFCAEGAHRLLVYEYMGNGSLDKWIFKKSEESFFLDWNTRFNIALGTAKGLAYLHEECEMKIIHCDIKPENVLLGDDFTAKVSDFGLAKLMTRDDSLVYTTVRGTRGYLAPEWITNNPISVKSDVYSYGILVLEIIAGRKNYDSSENSEKSHLPSYSFKMLQQGKVKEIIDPLLDIDENDERVVTIIKVALWCIQDDMQLRPPMNKVIQMLEGLCEVPDPPIFCQLGSWAYFHIGKRSGEGSSTVGYSDHTNYTFQSDDQLSGPR